MHSKLYIGADRPIVTVEKAVEILNEIHKLDPSVLTSLVNYRIPCNKELGEHPTVQVGIIPEKENPAPDRPYEVGLLGIINGIFGAAWDGYGYIGAEYDENNITEFKVIR